MYPLCQSAPSVFTCSSSSHYDYEYCYFLFITIVLIAIDIVTSTTVITIISMITIIISITVLLVFAYCCYDCYSNRLLQYFYIAILIVIGIPVFSIVWGGLGAAEVRFRFWTCSPSLSRLSSTTSEPSRLSQRSDPKPGAPNSPKQVRPKISVFLHTSRPRVRVQST